jgi:Transposase, Mutator family
MTPGGHFGRACVERHDFSPDRVSAISRALDEQLELFRQWPLEGAYPYLWRDAKHLKVRDHGLGFLFTGRELQRCFEYRACGGGEVGEIGRDTTLASFLRFIELGLTSGRVADVSGGVMR